MPFGLKNAGDSFCRLISSALKEVKNNDNFKAYVDDIFIHSREFQTYSDTLRQILNLCRKFDLKLNGKKCDFLKSENKFLGRIISKNGYSADPEYLQAIRDLAPPRNKK